MSERSGDPAASGCRGCEPLLAAYVDGEATAHDRERLEKHVESCACCRDWLGRERAAREALRARRAGLRCCASEPLKARCAAFAARPVASAPSLRAGLLRPSTMRRWVPVSLAATLVFVAAAVFGLGLNNKVQALAVQTTVDHVACSRFSMPEGTADPAAAASRWQERFGWTVRLPASTGDTGLQLRGLRRCAVTDGRVAHLLYSWKGEPLSIYVLPKRTLGDAVTFARRFQHESVMWSQNDRTYIIVTARPHDAALDKVVDYVRAAAY